MEVARVERAPDAFIASLAGLQAGMIATLWMLAWMGVSAAWQRTSFWTAENLLASTFYGSAAIHTGFSHRTVSGLALYLVVYSLLGCLVAVAMRNRLQWLRLVLVSLAVAIGWYYLSFHLIWKAISPLVTLLHAEQSTALGHVIFGVLVARFPRYLRRLNSATPPEQLAAAAASHPEPLPANLPDPNG
jgi:hypothetical protein